MYIYIWPMEFNDCLWRVVIFHSKLSNYQKVWGRSDARSPATSFRSFAGKVVKTQWKQSHFLEHKQTSHFQKSLKTLIGKVWGVFIQFIKEVSPDQLVPQPEVWLKLTSPPDWSAMTFTSCFSTSVLQLKWGDWSQRLNSSCPQFQIPGHYSNLVAVWPFLLPTLF